jgi:photosystem II stability/assembly factor-like uncharacterized protein
VPDPFRHRAARRAASAPALALATAAALVAAAAPLAAQPAPVSPTRGRLLGAPPPERAAPPLAPPGALDTSALAALTWREIGPYRGGRSVAVAGSRRRPNEYWMGTTGGGVFKSTDGGMNWQPVTDKFFGGTVGYIAVAESNPDVVYVGTGEYPIRGNVSHGEGVYKSTDAGKTWAFLGLKGTRQISRVRVHPTNPDVVWVAAQGAFWGPGRERGVYKSTDGGRTWKQTLFRNDSTGASDLVVDPADSNVLYAAMWQAYRTAWGMSSGGAGSSIYKSTDGGETWKELTRNRGLPAGPLGNMGLAVSPANPRRVWAQIEADSGGLFRSDDAGATWAKVNEDRKLRQRAWYYSKVFADPKDSNTVYALNVGFYRSTDGGRTFKQSIAVPHGDNHDMWIAPDDPQRMIEGNDGGANVSVNGGKTWTGQEFATAQFYHVTTTNEFPYRVCGAQQDNSTLCGPSRWPGGIGRELWVDAGGGESGYIAVDPTDPNVSFAGSYGGLLTRKDMRADREVQVNPWPVNPMGQSSRDLAYRFQWTFPILFSPHDPRVLYAAGNHLFRTTTGGQSWEVVSPDLTRRDPRTMGPSGGPITRDQTGVETYATIFTAAESPRARGVIWAGSDDGLVHVTRDNGRSWQNVTPPGLGDFTRVSLIEASPHDPAAAYLAANRYQLGDLRPILFKTADYGRTWTRITSGIPDEEFTRAVREDPVRRGLLYAATERGVWVSFDDGARWQSLRRNLPPVPVHDLVVKDGDLVIATHGRSFHVMDDLSALRQMTPQTAAAAAHLYKPRDAHRVSWGGNSLSELRAGKQGKNPPSGAVVYYALSRPNQDVRLDFLDARGRLLRSFTSRLDSIGLADSARGAQRSDSAKRAQAAVAAAADSLTRRGGPATSSNPTMNAAMRSGESEPAADPEEALRRGPRPPRVPNKVGLNQFAWDLREPDAARFEGMILWAGATAGPVVPPGAYAVRMTVAGQPAQTQTFAVLNDPRSRATAADVAETVALQRRVLARVTEANLAVRTARNLRAQVAARRAQLPEAQRAAFDAVARTLLAPVAAAEEEIYQVRNQSSQDPLNYPIKLNNKLAALAGVVASADPRPTRQSYVAFDTLSRALDVQLGAMRQAMAARLPALNARLAELKLAPVVPSDAEVRAPDAARVAAAGDDEDEEGAERRRW